MAYNKTSRPVAVETKRGGKRIAQTPLQVEYNPFNGVRPEKRQKQEALSLADKVFSSTQMKTA